MFSPRLLEITVGYWGGTTSYRMEVTALGPHELKIRIHHGADSTSSGKMD
jgi:hypothetical protein